MRTLFLSLILVFVCNSCLSQSRTEKEKKIVGGPCEGCEAILEYGNKLLSTMDTLPSFKENEPKLKITGTVFQKDGKTPAENVILYIYHTNRKGIYETKGDEKGWAKRHGHIRGWIKTNSDGKYTFYTFRPAPYPNRQAQEHIHMIVKEPGLNEYYISDYVFDDDPLLNRSVRKKLKNRGGSGIVKAVLHNGIYQVERNITLGLHIPGYD